MRISDWSSDVCSSDLELVDGRQQQAIAGGPAVEVQHRGGSDLGIGHAAAGREEPVVAELVLATGTPRRAQDRQLAPTGPDVAGAPERAPRAEEHTSELQSLMRTSYAVFCLKNKNHTHAYIRYVKVCTI